MSRPFKRVLAEGDYHCGHRVGLTPKEDNVILMGDRKGYQIRREIAEARERVIEEMGPFDLHIINADCVDGKGKQTGEHLTTDMNHQCNLAIKNIRMVECPLRVMTYGTDFHVGSDGADMEDTIAAHVGAKIGSHEWVEVNGTTFDIKHHLGSSSVPHGRATAAAKDRIWNILWEREGMQPGADVFIRSHVHYFGHCGGDGWLAMTLPALQGAGSKYGARRCSGTVDMGVVTFDCYDDGSYTWQVHLFKPKAQKAQAWSPFGSARKTSKKAGTSS